MKLLQDELYLDFLYGLSGKTIIHPAQIAIVHQAYQVNDIELKQAQDILEIWSGCIRLSWKYVGDIAGVERIASILARSNGQKRGYE